MNPVLILSTLLVILHASPGMPHSGYKIKVLLELDDGPLSVGDEVVIDGKFRNRAVILRFISISPDCPGPTPLSPHVLPQCHPLIMRFKPRYHQIQILYKSLSNREIEVDVLRNVNVTIGLSYQLLIKVGRRNFTMFLNGQHIKTMDDEIGRDNIIHIRSFGGYYRDYYVVRAAATLRDRYTCGLRPGFSTADVRITGGVNAKTGEFPWQAAIRRKFTRTWAPNKHFCGASLINSCWVVTAAHCLADVAVNPKAYTVRVGDYFNGEENLFAHREAVEDFDIERVISHEHFRARPSPLHDIALIKLKSNKSTCATFNDFVWPICLPTRNETKPVGSICTVTGWGAKKWSDHAGLFPNVLQKADIKIKDHVTCRKSYGRNFQGGQKVAKETVCASDTGKDACQGDSGGPLACKRTVPGSTPHFVLWGVTSWGETCAKPDKPGIFTRVVDYLDWIEHNMRED